MVSSEDAQDGRRSRWSECRSRLASEGPQLAPREVTRPPITWTEPSRAIPWPGPRRRSRDTPRTPSRAGAEPQRTSMHSIKHHLQVICPLSSPPLPLPSDTTRHLVTHAPVSVLDRALQRLLPFLPVLYETLPFRLSASWTAVSTTFIRPSWNASEKDCEKLGWLTVDWSTGPS